MQHPDYKYNLENATDEHEGVNPSCGDELVLKLRVENGVIEEAAFTGHGCAVSQASADMMADLVTGETVEEARRLCGLFLKMVKGEELTEDEREDLDLRPAEPREHLPHARRVKCAELGWRHAIRDDWGLATVSPASPAGSSKRHRGFFCKILLNK